MPLYELYGRPLQSDLPLPELRRETGVTARSSLRFERRMPGPSDGDWFVISFRPDGGDWLRAHRTALGYRLQYCKCAEFDLDLADRAITGDTINCSEDMFRHFLIDQIVPLMLSVDAIVLHASSVAVDGKWMVAFAGPGGAGKSTLATALARRGHALGSDDALLLERDGERVRAVPAYPGVRLWNDSEAVVATGLTGAGRPEPIAKQRFREGLRFVDGPKTLTHVYVIDRAASHDIRFEPLSARDTVVELVREIYRLALDDRDALSRELRALAELAPRLPVWRFSFPRNYDRWPDVVAAVEQHIYRHTPAGASC